MREYDKFVGMDDYKIKKIMAGNDDVFVIKDNGIGMAIACIK